jgi:rubrerythrin
MGLLQSIRKLGLKSILSSALTLEEEIYSLYSALKSELAGVQVPYSLVRILDEELGHQNLIRDMIDGRISDQGLKQIIKGKDLHIHDLRTIEELPPDRYRLIRSRLETILAKEREIYNLFAGLHRKSKIPFAHRAFGFLEEQERTHIEVLERLLGRSGSAEPHG